ncbi:hypothetical protein [Erwinia sp. 9145]|uniref:hypothetical protein n=1 Tax=Erwinia sp. 9145 TaxID=1500895 RepID=UPI00054FF970|nr:hypothetical protein [Erwinia sp. 9145]
MQIDNDFLNKILSELAEEYPGTMSQEAFKRVCSGQTDGRKVAGHFKLLEELGYIETAIYIDYDHEPRIYEVNIHKTRIFSSGIHFLKDGGFQ